jgi:hypothetical protein
MLVSSVARAGLVAENRRNEAAANTRENEAAAVKARQEQAATAQAEKEKAVSNDEASFTRPPETSEAEMALRDLMETSSKPAEKSVEKPKVDNAFVATIKESAEERRQPTVEDMSLRVRQVYELE